MIINLTKDTFRKEVIESEIPVIVDFWAPWCGHCINLMPVIDELAEEADGRYKVCKINIDEEQELAMQFGVMTIPTCARFEGGELKSKTVGALPKAALTAQLGI